MKRRSLLRSALAALLGGHSVPGLARTRPVPILLQRVPFAEIQFCRGDCMRAFRPAQPVLQGPSASRMTTGVSGQPRAVPRDRA